MWLKTLERVTVFFIGKLILKVEVQFEDEKPAWIPLETLLQYKSTCQINSIVTGGDTMKTIEDHIQRDKDLLTDPTISSQVIEGIIRRVT